MAFVDEAQIEVQAGRGGDGCVSFRRERCVPLGGPDGGDGGHGGNVHVEGDSGINTLVDFRHLRLFRAGHGGGGSGRNRAGANGDDITIRMPVGTIIKDVETGEKLADLQVHGERSLIAKGGIRGLGNTRFKSSTNQAPRQMRPGKPGEHRRLSLELRLLADIGMAGWPNAGKSSLLRAISAARPKTADYPFTTLQPELGVVRLGVDQSFVVADMPGLILGASEGVGLGNRFLRHLSRTRLLWHVVDLFADDDIHKMAELIRQIEHELQSAPEEYLHQVQRWLVFNKVDLAKEADIMSRGEEIIKELNWSAPVYYISAVTGQGCEALCRDTFKKLQEKREAAEKPDYVVNV